MRRRIASFGARHPLLLAALVSLLAMVASAFAGPWLGGAVVLGAVIVATWACGLRVAVGLAAVTTFSLSMFVHRQATRERAERELPTGQLETIEAILLEDARVTPRGWVATARTESGRFLKTKVQWLGAGSAPVAGSRVRGAGRFEPLRGGRNPGEFDRAKWLRGLGVAASFRAHPEGSEVVTPWWAKIGGQVRHGFREAVTYGLPPNGEAAVVIRAVVMGERPKDAEALIAAFRNSGTLHVFCVSGLHVGLVGAFGWLIFRGLGLTRRTAILGLVIVMFGYAWLTGNGPPAVRAAWMATVFLGAFVLRRQPDLLNALGGVLLALLLWDGRLIFQPGVQLSYGVVAAIAVGCRVTYRIFEPLAREEPYVPRSELSPWQHRWHLLRLRTAQSLAVSSSAWVGSAPLTAFHFALITPISVFASVLMMPAVFCLLGAALVSALCFPFAPVVSLSLNRVNGLLASGTVHLARASATVPGGNIQLRREGDPFLLIYDLGFGANGACFSGGRDGAVLINAGDAFGFKQRMLPSLAWLGVRPDAAIFTHPEGSCMGGGEAVWNALPLRQVMLPVRESRSAAYHAWLDARKHRRWQTRFAQAGDTLPLPAGATWRVLRVAAADTRDALADDRVAIAMMDWGGWKFLWLNDAGLATERELLASGMDLRADVIVASKHQRDSQLSDDLIRRVQPRAVILSNEDHPDAMIRYWRSLGIKVIEQSATGGLTTKLSPHGELIIHGFVDHSRFLLDPSP